MLTDIDPLTIGIPHVDILAGYFKGTRKELFLDSIAVIRESMAAGTWVSRGRQRADKGINKGIAAAKSLCSYPGDRKAHDIYMAACYGQPLQRTIVDDVSDEEMMAVAPKVPRQIMRYWLEFLAALRPVYRELDASRPLPTYTEIGLSPKVTATLMDATVGLDLTTRRLCPLGSRWVPMTDKHGRQYTVKVYFPKWPEDTVFGSSRFSHCDCQACGKSIPSGRVVPVLLNDKAGAVHGFWFGRDCAANILGIKDAGIERNTEALC